MFAQKSYSECLQWFYLQSHKTIYNPNVPQLKTRNKNYSAIKKEWTIDMRKNMKFKYMILNERSQTKKSYILFNALHDILER